ncbi:MAG: TldD/PmbA family protein [Bacteroidales bacterium]|nr:TldD/PmbA family protein [Bacteroidales bacterium]
MNTLNYYLDIFKVTVPQMESLVAKALERGGDFADLYFEYTTFNNLMLRDSEVTSGGFHIDYGVGVRTISGDRTGYAYAENTRMRDMMDAAAAASAIASGTSGTWTQPASRLVEAGADLYPVLKSWRKTELSEFVPFLHALERAVLEREKRAVKVIARVSSSDSDVLMFNSLGEITFDSRPMGSVVVSVIYSDGRNTISKSSSRSFRTGAEMLDDALVETLADEVVRNVDALLEAERPKGGQMPVVMGAGASGILLHEAMGHAFEADFNRKGQSIFAGRIGERVAAKGINVVDDGLLAANRGAGAFDDEGVRGEKTYMVTDGVLTSYLHDRVSARYYGLESTGNGRRECFRFNPIPRMRATYMEGGADDPRAIIESVRKGIYCAEFTNGQVKIGEGDFTFYVKSGWMIENGRLTRPVKDINIIGNGPKALADITMVGNDLKVDNGTWTCGKDQSVPVSCGIPTVLVKSLAVGGM